MLARRQFLTGASATIALFTLGTEQAHSEQHRNISYGSGNLDIYTPGAANAPVLVYVHGGAWRAGSKSTVGSMPRYFNDLGYVFVSISYRLSGGVDGQVSDVSQAVGWIGANIASYGGNPERIALMGHSAGCHLSCLAVLSGRASGVRALVANDTAAYDIAYLAEINNGRLPILYQALNSPSDWAKWSPISYAGGGGGVPVLVAWSGGQNRDRVSMRFADRLSASGHPVTRFDGSRYSHVSIRNSVGRRGDPVTSAITNFLQQNL
jgi:acetyl esterase/lipase